ncbi:MAG: trimethylamine methyltransferase family protein [Actinobacteria bacterium]|nr:trimethylamine methyltransferase family protein [Actinomycetota bacterium]
MRRGFTRNIPPVKVLTDSQVEAIHRATLDVLEETGCRFESKRALQLFEKNGCIVDYEDYMVRIPSYLVEECTRITPNSFLVRARNPKNNLMMGGNNLYYMSSAGARICDPYSGEARMATMEENDQAVLISDALDSLDCFPSYTPYFEIEGVEPVMLCPTSCASRLRFSSKVSRGAQPTETYIWETQLAQAVGAQLFGNMEAAPPLSYPEDAINAGWGYAEAGFPIYIAAGAVMGGTAPVTLAGSTISNSAELLAALVFLQLVKPGIGIIANDFVTPMDMRSGNLFFGALGASLHQMAFNQIWNGFYKIPTNNTGSAFPNSKIIDYQCGYEKTHLAMASALSGANMIVLHGGVSSELAYHPLQAILDDDMAHIVGRTIEGFDVNYETMALELIKEVGPVPGTYLNKPHTREHWKKEYFVPKSSDRLMYPDWLKSGKKKAIDYARERMEYILANHKVEPITPQQDKELDRILQEARNYYRKKGLL